MVVEVANRLFPRNEGLGGREAAEVFMNRGRPLNVLKDGKKIHDYLTFTLPSYRWVQ
jgi:hypothetical protein